MDTTVGLIADFAHKLQFADLPPAAIHYCKRSLIDTMGCALGGFDAKPSKIAREMALRAHMPLGARILGTSHRTLPELAAFANGVMARYLDANDIFLEIGGHPSDTTSALLAIAESNGASGRELITAVTLAYEVYYRLFAVTHLFDKGIDNSFHAAVGSSIGAAKLMHLDRAAMMDAVSLAVTPNISLRATRSGHLSMWKGCAGANAARNGVFAALLAAAGITGPDSPIGGASGLEGLFEKVELAPFAGDGRPFAITKISLKHSTVAASALPLITVALPLSKQVAFEDIEKVTIYTYRLVWEFNIKAPEKRRPTTREAADHSMPYILAAILIERDFSDAIFSEERLADPRVRQLIDKIEIKEDGNVTGRFPEAMPCRVEIRTKQGELKVAETDFPRGHAKNPMTDDEVNAKFHNLARKVLSRERIDRALDALWHLDTARDLSAVFDAINISDS